jgi:MFS family permease
MNWIKGKKQRIVIIISVAMILCGFLMIPLSRRADNFPHDIWSNLIFLMTMAGGGGIGAVISLHIISRRSKKKRTIIQDSHTNRLKEKAWKDLWTICVMAIVGLLFFGFATYANIRGVWYLLAGLCPVCVMAALAVFGVYKEHEKQNPSPFDEREFYLIQQATHIGNSIFLAYVSLAIITAFNLIGGRGMIPVWTLPLALFSGLFLAGTVQFIFLMHHAKQDDKNAKGGTV